MLHKLVISGQTFSSLKCVTRSKPIRQDCLTERRKIKWECKTELDVHHDYHKRK